MRQSNRHARLRRAARARQLIRRDCKVRVVAHRSGTHIYAQVVDAEYRVLASASTAEKEMRQQFKSGSTIAAASAVGERLAQKVKEANLDPKVVFDRSGFKYHGRIKALADGARTGGMEF